MNKRMVFYMVGRILKLEAALLLLPLFCAIFYGEYKGFLSFLATIAIALIVGFGLTIFNKPKDKTFFAKEGFAIVALSWIVVSVIGSLPFVISREIPSFIDSFFETVSGFTTTGATILKDVEAMSKGMLFWRSFTHWIGGMGVLVLFMALLPSESGRNIHIMRAEMPGPIVGKLVPRIRTTAKILYLIYIAMTLIEIILLLAGGMPLFDSLMHSFGTAGTGGFGIKNDSIGGYSPYIQWVITIFMILFGVNFNLYYLLLLKRVKAVFKSEELWAYLGVIAASVLIITFNIFPQYQSISESLRHSAFQVSSIISTTGFSTTDFNTWPNISKLILFLLMFIGACAGSTGGGIKVSRVVLLFKQMRSSLKHMLHPRSVEAVRFEGKKIESSTITNITTYFALFFACFTVIFIILCVADPFDLVTNSSAVAACINNVGPGFSLVGPLSSYADFSGISKFALSAGMLLGRLEILPMILLFAPSAWIKTKKSKGI